MKFVKLFFLVVILLILALVATYFFSGTLLKKGITEAGPAILGVEIELESLAADPIRGNVEVVHMVIHNPEGFNSDYAFKIDDFTFNFNPISTFNEAVHIHELTIEGASIISDGLLADNHRTILNRLVPNSKKPASEPVKETAEPKEKKPGRKLIIDHFAFRNSSLIIVVDGEEITKVDFPDVELSNIGTEQKATTAAEAIRQIYTAIMSETTKVLSVNEEVIENIARAKLKKMGINDIKDLENPEKILKNPEAIQSIFNALTAPKDSGKGN